MRYQELTQRAGEVLRQARAKEGLSQAELALRMGTSQSTVARLEAGGANPTIATLDKALRACGHKLELAAVQLENEVDESLLAAHLKMTPSQRLAKMQLDYRRLREISRRAERTRRSPGDRTP